MIVFVAIGVVLLAVMKVARDGRAHQRALIREREAFQREVDRRYGRST